MKLDRRDEKINFGSDPGGCDRWRGTMLGELAVLLERSHTADVRAVTPTACFVLDAGSILRKDTAVAQHVAAVLAQRVGSPRRSSGCVEAQGWCCGCRERDRSVDRSAGEGGGVGWAGLSGGYWIEHP